METYDPEPGSRAGAGDPKTDPTSALGRAGAQWAGEGLEFDFRREVAGLVGQHGNPRFPGAQPVSFSAMHLHELKQRDYWVCEKTDGERYLLWMTQDGNNPLVYFINRKNEYFYVPGFFFPHHERRDDFHRDTILDGELVEDKYPDGRTEINFLVFDMLVLDGQSMMHRTLDKRMGYFKEQILKPYQKSGKGPFAVKDKAIEFAYGLEKMFLEIIPKVKSLHGNDGLIFTCKETPYQMGTDKHILKWKPPNDNTVDFLMHINWATVEPDPSDPIGSLIEDYDAFPTSFDLFIYEGNDREGAKYTKQGDLYVTEQEWTQWKAMGKPLQDIVVECYQEDLSTTTNGNGNTHMNGNGGHPATRWRWYRFRHDKDDANHVSTYRSVIDSILDRVTQEDLLKETGEIRDSWKKRDAAEKAKNRR